MHVIDCGLALPLTAKSLAPRPGSFLGIGKLAISKQEPSGTKQTVHGPSWDYILTLSKTHSPPPLIGRFLNKRPDSGFGSQLYS